MTTRREKLLQKLNPNLLKMTPKLSGGSGTFIDLSTDGDSLEEGARKLMLRFLKNQDLSERNKKNQTEVTVSSAKFNENEEICELVSEKLTYTHVKDPDEELNSDKPGRKLQLLKMELQNKMSAKFEEEYKKRLNESKNYKESGKDKKKGYEESCNEDSEAEEDEESCKETKDKNESDDEDNGIEEDSDEENGVDGDADDENDIEEDADDENDSEPEDEDDGIMKENEESKCNNEDEFDDGDGCSLVPAYQPGGGLLYGGSDLTQSEEGLPDDLLLPSLQLTATQSPNSKGPSLDNSELRSKESGEEADQSSGFRDKLFQDSQKVNDSFDLSDAFAFCSGKFPEPDANIKSQNNTVEQDSVSDEKDSIDNTKCKSDEEEEEEEEDGETKGDEENEDEDEEEGESENDIKESDHNAPKVRKNILLLEDSETEDSNEPVEEQDNVLAGKILSDNEDEENNKDDSLKKRKRKTLHFSDDDDASNNDEESESLEEAENSEDEEEEDCDQRSINYDSEENEIINPKEFFEKEAELSGSEWSGDEDEKGLDEFDQEDGDADVLDNDQVRSQLEKIHIRRVLDDDAREVRLIQEILFEDGDLHSDGKGRDRKFKWKNLGAFDDKENETENKDDPGHSSEDDCAEEEEWRKLRHQKELFLMELKKNENLSSDDEIVEENFQLLKVTTKNSLKLSVTKERIVDSLGSAIKTDLVKPSICNARGSFLTRNEEFLSRLAKVSSAVSDNVLQPNHSKNYLFLTKSPKKDEPAAACKRQVEELESCVERKKKMKLFPGEIDTGPSILDLLV